MRHTRSLMKCGDWLTALVFILAVSWSAAFAQSSNAPPSVPSEAETPAETGTTDNQPAPQTNSPIDRSEFTYDGKPFSHWHKLLVAELKPEKRLPALRAVIAFGSNGYADEATRDLIQVLNGYDEESLERLSAVMEEMNGGEMVDPQAMQAMAVYTGMIAAAVQKEAGSAESGLPPAVPNLEAILSPMASSPMAEIHLVQTTMVGIMSTARQCSIDVLIGAVSDNRSRGGMGRNAAISVLAAYRSQEPSAIDTVLRVVADSRENESTRDTALNALAESPPEPEVLLNALKPQATAKNPKLRRWGIAAYGKFGESARGAAPILLAALSDSDPQVVVNAAQSLSKTDQLPRSEAPKLLRLLSNHDESVCNDAATQLGELGFFRAYRSADDDASGGYIALKAFAIAPGDLKDPQLMPGYLKIAKRICENTNYSTDVALAVIQILGEIGRPTAIDSADALRKIAANEKQSAELRKAAETALSRITGSAEPQKEVPW